MGGIDDGVYDFVKMAEFSHKYMTAKSNAPCAKPQFELPDLGIPDVVEEGSGAVQLSGKNYMIEPWVRMYQNTGDGITVTMDWRDQWSVPNDATSLPKDDFDRFSDLDGWPGECRHYDNDYDGFSNCMFSFAWCGPGNAHLAMYDGEHYEEGDIENEYMTGTGYTRYAAFKDEGLNSKFNHQAGSARIFWCRSGGLGKDTDDNDTCINGEWYPWDVDVAYEWRLDGDVHERLLKNQSDPTLAVYTPGPGGTTDRITLMHMGKEVFSKTVRVANIGPTMGPLSITPAATVEGQELTLNGTWQDGSSQQVDLSIDWGDGSTSEKSAAGDPSAGGYGGPIVEKHTYIDDGSYSVTVTVSDGTEAVQKSTAVDVANVVPLLDAGDDQQINEGTLITLAPAVFSDPGILDIHTAMVDWGDGTAVESGQITFSSGAGTVTSGHVYADDGGYQVTVCIRDDDMADLLPPICDSFAVTVNNVLPTLEAGADQVIFEGDTLVLDPAIFHDRGTLDTHTATIAWGDSGAPEAGEVVEVPYGPPGSTDGSDGSISGTHQYKGPPGFYTILICVKDDDMSDDAPAVCDTLTVTVTHGFMRFCAYANRQSATVYEGADLLCSISGAEDITLKKNSSVAGDVISGDDVTLNEGSSVGGMVLAADKVRIKGTVDIVGGFIENGDIPAVTDVTVRVRAWWPTKYVRKNKFMALDPGTYGYLIVKEGATLQLTEGSYTFRGIRVEKNATIEFVISGGKSTVINVQRSVSIHQGVQMVPLRGAAEDILFKVGGRGVLLGKDSALVGTFIAPRAYISLYENGHLNGHLYGKKVRIRKHAQVTYAPALTPFLETFLR